MLNRLNYFLYRCKYRYAPFLKLETPVDISMELSSICNCRCPYCYHAMLKLPFEKGYMSFDTARKIIIQAAHYGVNSLKFNWRGESTLNPYFEAITTFAKDHAIGSTFIDRISNTNMKFQNGRTSPIVGLCNQTKVKISLDSFIPQVYEAQRVGANLENVLKNIDDLYHYKKRNNIIVIQAVRTALNADEDIYGEVKKRWPSATISIRDVVEGRNDLDNTVSLKQRNFNERKPCVQAFNRLIFNWNGKAMPCCPDTSEKLMLGDINEYSLKHIFNNYKAQSLRLALKNKSAFDQEPCKSCSSFESFKGNSVGWHS